MWCVNHLQCVHNFWFTIPPPSSSSSVSDGTNATLVERAHKIIIWWWWWSAQSRLIKKTLYISTIHTYKRMHVRFCVSAPLIIYFLHAQRTHTAHEYKIVYLHIKARGRVQSEPHAASTSTAQTTPNWFYICAAGSWLRIKWEKLRECMQQNKFTTI